MQVTDTSILWQSRGEWRETLVTAVLTNPGTTFLVFALFHVALWTVLPTLLCRNLPWDVLEGIAYGQEWQLGYWKHPPLPWWLVDIVHRVAGSRIWPFFLLGQLAIFVCFCALWRLSRLILRPLEALVAIVLLDGCPFVNFATFGFNHNVVEWPIWALAGWSLYQAFVRGKALDWIFFGLCLALAFYAKYTAITLLVPLVIFALFDFDARRCWRTPGPYLAGLVFAVVIAPHAVWLIGSDFAPFQFVNGKAAPVQGLMSHVLLVPKVLGAVGYQIGLVLAMFCALHGKICRAPPPASHADRFARRYVSVLALGPLSTAVIVDVFAERNFHPDWLGQYWCFIGLFLMTIWRPLVTPRALSRLAIAWSTATCVLIGAQISEQVFHVRAGEWRTLFPGDQLTQTITDVWHREMGRPLPYVVGGSWLAGNVIFHSTDRPHMFFDANPKESPWIDEQDVRRRGAVLLWIAGRDPNHMPEDLRSRFPEAQARGIVVPSASTIAAEHTWRIGWATLPPQANQTPAPSRP